MAELDVYGASGAACAFAPLVVRLGGAAVAFDEDCGREEGGGVEVRLEVAEDLGGGFMRGFVDC